MRADAVRNRAKVLAVAERLFDTKGIAVEMDEIAGAAGLAVGTIYRHFPTKEALVEAVVVTPIEELIEEARALARHPDPSAAFYSLFEKLVELASAKHHLIAAFVRAGHSAPVGTPGELASRHDRFHDAFGKLLVRAQSAGAVRPDIRVPELVAIINGAFPYLERDRAGRAAHRRLLTVIEDALSPSGARRSGGKKRPKSQ
jgi:AcrR family transcriptional regulator